MSDQPTSTTASSGSAAAPYPLPLLARHRRLGASFTAVGGSQAVAGYGDLAAEYRAITEGVAFFDRSHVGRVELLGDDRARFLGGMCTCEVQELAAGRATYGFITGAKGRILADMTLLALSDRLWMELPAGRGKPVRDHLGKYIIAEPVELLPLADMLPFTLLGPDAAELLRAEVLEEGEAPPPGHHRRAMALGSEVVLEGRRLAGQPAFVLWVSASVAPPLLDDLLALGDVTPVGLEAYEAARVEAGEPAWGRDFDDGNLPQESGREEEAVSYTKGCYLGQEVVARVHYRGGVKKAMRRLVFAAATPPAPGTALSTEEGDEVGTVGSVAVSPADGRRLGLAILHQKGSAPATRLQVAGGGVATVEELPGS